MVRFQSRKVARVAGAVLVLCLLSFIGYELVRQKPAVDSLTGRMPDLATVEFNLRLLRQYNTPTGSVISDFGSLFAGEYSAPAYSIIKYDLTSAMFLVILPLITMFCILTALGVSRKMLVVVMLIFGAFTFLPLVLI